MPLPEHAASFAVVVTVLTVVPGPDTALGLRNSMLGGGNAMWWTGLGVCSGIVVHATASVVGLSALLAASATAYGVVKIAGAMYLIWLGASTLWRTWSERVELTGRSRDTPDEKNAFTRTGVARPSPRPPQEIIVIDRRTAFRQGFISDILNPKIALLFITLLPQFIGISESRVHTSISLTVIFVAIALAWWRVTSWLAGATHRILTRDSVRRTINHISGVVLVALGLRVAFTP